MSDNSETVSKKKRGRPKGLQTRKLESGMRPFAPDGSHRTKIKWVFMMEVFELVMRGGSEVQQIVMGCAVSDLHSGVSRFPRGWTTHAPEIGRFLAGASDAGKKAVLKEIVDARTRGLNWSDIAAHYRRLRLGAKSGNPVALSNALTRVIHEYWRQFPKTADHVFVEALRGVLRTFDDTEVEAEE